MAQAAGKNPKDRQLGLNDADYERLHTFMADIAAAQLPNARVQHYDTGETRIGNKGSLSIESDGRWYSFEAADGGFGPASLLRYLMPDADADTLHRYAARWLREHAGTGGNTGDRLSEDDEARAARNAAFAQAFLAAMVPIEGTPAEAYLLSRGLTARWPPGLLG